MTRILLFSDSHGYLTFMEMALEQHPGVDCVFHLGDGTGDADALRRKTRCPVRNVCGNCDGWSDVPAEREFESDGVRLLLTHGHRYRVKSRLDALAYRAMEAGADAALFGHTHRPTMIRAGETLLINPGAANVGDYALLTLESGKITVELKNASRGR